MTDEAQQVKRPFHSPFTFHYSPFTIHLSLFTFHYSLFTFHFSLHHCTTSTGIFTWCLTSLAVSPNTQSRMPVWPWPPSTRKSAFSSFTMRTISLARCR